MKKASSAMIGVLLVVMVIAPCVGAFEMGENRMENSSFETGEVGVMPEAWGLKIVG